MSVSNLFVEAVNYYEKCLFGNGINYEARRISAMSGDCFFEQALLSKDFPAYKKLGTAHRVQDDGNEYVQAQYLKTQEERDRHSNAIKAANRFEQEESSCAIM